MEVIVNNNLGYNKSLYNLNVSAILGRIPSLTNHNFSVFLSFSMFFSIEAGDLLGSAIR